MEISGVYKITNKITGESYIGSSKDVKRRWSCHKSSHNWRRFPGRLIYQAFQQYGLENFDFEIIEKTDDLKNREQYFIDLLKPEYNIIGATTRMTRKEYMKQYYKSEKSRETQRKYLNRPCSYDGEILTLNALYHRFYREGIEHPIIEAKMYLIESN